MNLVKTSVLNGIAVICKMLSLLGINKLLAIYGGPAGYAIVGQFQSVVQMVTTFGSGAINTGVVRYTVEYELQEERQLSIWRAAGTISLIGGSVSAFIVLLFRHSLSTYFLKNEDYSGVFVWLALGLVFIIFNTLFLAILNGKKEIKKYVLANISGSLFSVIFTYFLSSSMGLEGALIALGTYQSVALITTVFICRKAAWFKFSYFFGKIDKASARNLFHYTLMALASAAFIPLSQILIRNYLTNHLSQEYAGQWEAMIRLCSSYLLFISSTLTVYYLPRLTEIKERTELQQEVLNGIRIIFPLVAFGSILIYFLREKIILLLFTPDFLTMGDVLPWQLLGETVKVVSWLLGYIFTAKGFVKAYIVSEFIFSFLLYILIVLLVPVFHFQGTAIAYFINYVGHLIFVFWVLRKRKVI